MSRDGNSATLLGKKLLLIKFNFNWSFEYPRRDLSMIKRPVWLSVASKKKSRKCSCNCLVAHYSQKAVFFFAQSYKIAQEKFWRHISSTACLPEHVNTLICKFLKFLLSIELSYPWHHRTHWDQAHWTPVNSKQTRFTNQRKKTKTKNKTKKTSEKELDI